MYSHNNLLSTNKPELEEQQKKKSDIDPGTSLTLGVGENGDRDGGRAVTTVLEETLSGSGSATGGPAADERGWPRRDQRVYTGGMLWSPSPSPCHCHPALGEVRVRRRGRGVLHGAAVGEVNMT
jgi:hypothetical protein